MSQIGQKPSCNSCMEREDRVGTVTVGSCCGHRDHEVVESKIFGVKKKKITTRIVTMDF